MAITSEQIVKDILAREGAEFTDNPTDAGGPTKWGITLTTLRQVHPSATVDDLRNLTEDGATAVYQQLYVAPFTKYANGDSAFLALLVDSAVQHGVTRVRGWLLAGPATYAGILATRIKFYGQIVVHTPSQLTFLDGWLNRVTQFIR